MVNIRIVQVKVNVILMALVITDVIHHSKVRCVMDSQEMTERI